RWIIKKCADASGPVGSVEVVDHGKNFHSRIFRLQEGHHLVVDGMDGGTLHYVEEFVGFKISALQVTVGCDNVQPIREEQINLSSIFAQRREAGCVIGNVEGGAGTFLGIHLDLGWRAFSFAMPST